MISVEQLSGFGEALKELRWNARMKQVEVCRATGMTAPQVSRYENGHEMPTVESLVRYLIAVGSDLCDLQRVLETGRVAHRSGPPLGEPTHRYQRASDVAREAATREKADTGLGAVEQVLSEGDRRLESSSALQEIVSGLVKLNLEGMDRMEHRMRSMEESMAGLKGAADDKKRAAE